MENQAAPVFQFSNSKRTRNKNNNNNNTYNENSFPFVLWRIVNECQTGAIQWSPLGTTILIDFEKFQREYLDNQTYFKTSKLLSFIRQLNLYGFAKKLLDAKAKQYSFGINEIENNVRFAEFSNANFRRNKPELLELIKRKTTNNSNISVQTQKNKQVSPAEKFKENKESISDDKISKLNYQPLLSNNYQSSLAKQNHQTIRNKIDIDLFKQLFDESINDLKKLKCYHCSNNQNFTVPELESMLRFLKVPLISRIKMNEHRLILPDVMPTSTKTELKNVSVASAARIKRFSKKSSYISAASASES